MVIVRECHGSRRLRPTANRGFIGRLACRLSPAYASGHRMQGWNFGAFGAFGAFGGVRSRTEDSLTGPSRANCRFRASVVPQLRLFNPPARPGRSIARRRGATALPSRVSETAPSPAWRPVLPHSIPCPRTTRTHNSQVSNLLKRISAWIRKNGKLGNWSVFSRHLAYISMCPPAGLAMGVGRAGRRQRSAHGRGRAGGVRGEGGTRWLGRPPQGNHEQGPPACCPAGAQRGRDERRGHAYSAARKRRQAATRRQRRSQRRAAAVGAR